MLSQQLLDRIRALIHSRTPERIDQFARELGKSVALHSKSGMLGSSAMIHAFNSLGNTEIKIRVLEARSVIQRVLHELQVGYSDQLCADIKHELALHATEAKDRVKSAILKYEHIIKNTELIEVETGLHRAIAESNAEIDLYVDRIQLANERQKNGKASHQNITVHSQGIVQIGDYATASLTLNLNGEARDALKQALDATNAFLADESNINRSEDLKELVSDAYKELEKQNPNNTKLYGYLNILTSAFQGIASAGAVNDLIKNAITLFTG